MKIKISKLKAKNSSEVLKHKVWSVDLHAWLQDGWLEEELFIKHHSSKAKVEEQKKRPATTTREKTAKSSQKELPTNPQKVDE